MAQPPVNGFADWCQGCASADAKGGRQNLPAEWREGDPVPEHVTVHSTPRERLAGHPAFVFKHDGLTRVSVQ